MGQSEETVLLKNNFKKVEEKFIDFFRQGAPRWPNEEHDMLRNHHKNFDNFSMKTVTIEQLGLTDLPADIIKEITLAFKAFKRGEEYI